MIATAGITNIPWEARSTPSADDARRAPGSSAVQASDAAAGAARGRVAAARDRPGLRRVNPEGAARLTALLTRAFAVGVAADPLDARRLQARHLGFSLENLHQDIQREIDALSEAPDATDPGAMAMRDSLTRVADEVAQLVLIAKAQRP